MLKLLLDLHFWTTNNVKCDGSGNFNYYSSTTGSTASGNGIKNFQKKNISTLSKNVFWESRGNLTTRNQKPERLKKNLSRLQELLGNYNIVHSQWKNNSILQILLSNGILIHLCVNLFRSDILKMAFDKYFVGKLAAGNITDAFFSTQNIILAYNTNQITMVNLFKSNLQRCSPEKITNMEPKIFHVIIPGPTGDKKLARNLTINNSFDLIVIWTKSSRNEIFPWRPTKRDQDQANVHVFKLRGGKIEALGYCWTQNDPLCLEFLSNYGELHFVTVEQKISRKGELSIEVHSYKIIKGKMPRTTLHSIPLHNQICSYSFSPNQEKLFLGTIDSYMVLYDLKQQTTKFSSRNDVIPDYIAWHPDSTIFVVGNRKAQFQCFDIALNPISFEISSEENINNTLKLSKYFKNEELLKLVDLKFSLKPQAHAHPGKYTPTDSLLFFNFENGQIGCIRFFANTGFPSDVHNSGLRSDVLVNRYLELNQLEKAVNLLLATNWETYGSICLIILHKITNFCLTKLKIKRSRFELLLKAYKSFSNNLNEEIRDEFGDQIIDLRRRLFFYLLRNEKFTEAFEIAHEIEDYDLFMDLFNCTKVDTNLLSLTNQCYNQAEFYYNQNESITHPADNDASDSDTSSTGSGCSNTELVTSFTSIEKDTSRRKSISSSITSSKGYKISSAKIKSPENLTIKPYSDDSSSLESVMDNIGIQIRTNLAEVTNLKQKIKINYIPPLPTFPSTLPHSERSNEINFNHLNRSKFRPIVMDEGRKYNLPPKNEVIQSKPGPSNQFNQNFQLTELLPPMEVKHFWPSIPDQTVGIPQVSSLNYIKRHNYGPDSLISSTPSNSPQSSLQYNSNEPLSRFLFGKPSQSRYFQHPLISGSIPSVTPSTESLKFRQNYRNENENHQEVIYSNIETQNVETRKDSNNGVEKNKVKFSDTVHIAVVPDISRKDKVISLKKSSNAFTINPKKELAESLPLCHPDDEYLKDFNRAQENKNNNKNFNVNKNKNTLEETTDNLSNTYNGSTNNEINNKNNNNNNGSIKVIHFGVV